MARPGASDASGLRHFFILHLRAMADADRQLARAFPRLMRGARHPKVRKFCREGISYSRNRLDRLDKVFGIVGARPGFRHSTAMARLVRDAEAVQKEKPSALRDTALIAAIQPISHHGRAGYSTLQLLASALGETRAHGLLHRSFREMDEAAQEMNGLLRITLLPQARRSRL